jgi:hypothetical protein
MRTLFVVIITLSLFGILFQLAADDSQKIELKFTHKFHIEEQEIECIECHTSASESTTGADNLFPSMELCADCHEVEEEDNCNLCHQDLDDPREVPRIDTYNTKFSHQFHLSKGLECESCHAVVAMKTMAEPYILPTMVECINCHESKFASLECATCHLPTDQLLPASHTPDFIHNHSDLARANETMAATDFSCMTCHKQSFCQDCHEGDNLDRLTHPLNFEFTHALAAQGKERECAVCHTQRSFCIDCHRDNLVLPHNHTSGWTNLIDGGRHRLEAASDLENCMACHEQNADQICQPCHGG